MTLLASILLLALTRAEIIERMKAPPVTKVAGLVQVVADCPSDMRREYQSPIAGFAADICNTLYRAEKIQPRRFADPGIVIYIGDVRTNETEIAVTRRVRDDGSRFTRLRVPAPGFADLSRLRRETVKAFFLAVKGVEIDDRTADAAIRDADPELRAATEYESLGRWLRGEPVEGDDEEMLRLQRAVLMPGVATVEDVLRFASRLYLYPEAYSSPFCGRYHLCGFRDAIWMAKKDLRVRFLAYEKSALVVAYGGGRGERLADAAVAYSGFLREIAAGKKSEDELAAMLDDAETKLNVAMEEARKREEGKGE